jgi:hypothetical protein
VAPRDRKPGRLIALEGTRAIDLHKAVERFGARHGDLKSASGVSWWDASGVFYECWLNKRERLKPSPRTLLLLYAADLVFRLRWEIRPALAAGQTVIAAPYVESAVAFGRACGLTRSWLTELLRFAPEPDLCYHVKEGKKSSGWKGKANDGFAEFCSAALSDGTLSFEDIDVRADMIRLLATAKRRRGCRRLS